MTRVGRPSLRLWGDAVGRGVRLGGLHAWGRAGVRGLRLWPGGGLRGPDLAAERSCGAKTPLALEVGVGGVGQLLLGAHGTAVLGGRAPSQVGLLNEPLVNVLGKHALGRLWQLWGPALLLPWWALSRLEGLASSAPIWPALLPLVPAHLALLLLLLQLHLVLDPLLNGSSNVGIPLLLAKWPCPPLCHSLLQLLLHAYSSSC